jgi:hypothetical protein
MLKTSKAINRDISSKFRSKLNKLNTISPAWMREDYCWSLLTPQEKDHINKSVSDLMKRG